MKSEDQNKNLIIALHALKGEQFLNRIPTQAIIKLAFSLSKEENVSNLRVLALRERKRPTLLKDSKGLQIFLGVKSDTFYTFDYELKDGDVYNVSLTLVSFNLQTYVFGHSEDVVYLNIK